VEYVDKNRDDLIVKQFLQYFDKIEALSACIELHERRERSIGKEQNPLEETLKALKNIKIGEPASIIVENFNGDNQGS
jgi:hypothetical protein